MIDVTPNLSKRITSDDCRDCGKCCESFEIWYDDESPEVVNSEIQRFKTLDTIGDKITTRKVKGGTWLVFNFPCKFLKEDKTCAIYESPNRPLLCRMFPYPLSDKQDCPKVPA